METIQDPKTTLTITISSCGREVSIFCCRGLTVSEALAEAKSRGLRHIRGSQPSIDDEKVEADKVLKPGDRVVYFTQRELKQIKELADRARERKIPPPPGEFSGE